MAPSSWLGTQAFTEINPNLFKNKRWSMEQFHPIIPRHVEAPLVFVAHPERAGLNLTPVTS